MRCALVCLLAGCHDPATRTQASLRDPIAPAPLTADAAVFTALDPCPRPVTRLGDGLAIERHELDAEPAAGVAPCFDVVRADLTRFRLRVLSKAQDGTSAPAPDWRDRFKLVAVTNAGMFHAKGTPVGMIVQDGTQLAKDNPKFGGYLAFDPITASDPLATITGRDCAGFDLAALRLRYRSIVQSNRLVGCHGEPLPWQDEKQYSAAAIGLDREGRVVFIHARAAVTMSELAKSVARLDLAGALFLEGGPEASLVVRGNEGELARVGSYETNFVENDANQSFWWLPNIIALEAI